MIELPERFRDRLTLRPAEISELTGLPRSSISTLLERGTLTRIKAGRDVLVPVADVIRLLSGEAEACAGEPDDQVAEQLTRGSERIRRELERDRRRIRP